MEALGAFAVLISLGPFYHTTVVVIVFFFMAANMSGIAQKMRSARHSQYELMLKLDRIIKLMEIEANQRSTERNA